MDDPCKTTPKQIATLNSCDRFSFVTSPVTPPANCK